jgi:hypothetical protein
MPLVCLILIWVVKCHTFGYLILEGYSALVTVDESKKEEQQEAIVQYSTLIIILGFQVFTAVVTIVVEFVRNIRCYIADNSTLSLMMLVP